MIKARTEVETDLDAKIPRDAVSSRSGGGKALSYLETWYVIDRLNKVFGNLGWDSETVSMQEVGLSSGAKFPAYVAKVRIRATYFDERLGLVSVTKEGTGWGSDKSANSPHEMATKEAESDALKRAAMKFGMSLGLALYDKSQENVEDEAPKMQSKGPLSAKPAENVQSIPKDTPTPDRDTLNRKITAISKVVIAKKLKSLDELKAEMKTKYGADATAALSDVHAKTLLTELETLANG